MPLMYVKEEGKEPYKPIVKLGLLVSSQFSLKFFTTRPQNSIDVTETITAHSVLSLKTHQFCVVLTENANAEGKLS